MTDGDSMTTKNLRDSAKGTFVTLDDYLPLTGYEPNATELADATELNYAVSRDINFQDSLDYTAPSSDLYMDDDTLGKLLAEVHRDYAHYRRAEGVSVSPSSVSVLVDRTGEPVERSDSDHFPCSVRNVKSAQNQFPVITQAERMVDRTGEPVEKMIAEECESSSAQIRTLFNEQRKTIIAECCEKVSHHEPLAAQAEQERRILQWELLRQQQDFREVHQQDLTKMKELQKFQNSTFYELTRQKFIEDQNTIMELSGRLQELQNDVNCMNDPKDFQDAESIRSGNSHVTSQCCKFGGNQTCPTSTVDDAFCPGLFDSLHTGFLKRPRTIRSISRFPYCESSVSILRWRDYHVRLLCLSAIIASLSGWLLTWCTNLFRTTRELDTSSTAENGRNYGQTLMIQWYLLKGICTDTHSQRCCGRDSSKKFWWNLYGKNIRIENVCLFIGNKDYSCRYTWMFIRVQKDVRILNVSWSNWKKCLGGRNVTQKLSRGHTIRNVTRKIALKDIVSKRIKRLQLYRVPHTLFGRP